MKPQYDSTPTVDKTVYTPRAAVGLRLEAAAYRVATVAVIGAAVVLAGEYHEPRLLALGALALVSAYRAHLLSVEADRIAPRLAPSVLRRLLRWYQARRLARAAQKPQPKPYRGVRVAGVEDAIKQARMPGEMARETEPVIVAGLTASDVYLIVCRAASIGLDERSWNLGTETVLLPSGRQLSRSAFRQVQAWLVERGMADKHPRYHLTATPETVLEVLK